MQCSIDRAQLSAAALPYMELYNRSNGFRLHSPERRLPPRRIAISATHAGGADASRVEFLQSSIEINLHMETSVSTLLALHA